MTGLSRQVVDSPVFLYNNSMKTKRHLWGMLGIVLLASLLTACDPQSFPYLVVNRVGVIDQTPFVRGSIHSSFGLGMGDPEPGPYFASLDEGRSWQEAPEPSGDPLPAIYAPVSSLIEVCVPQEAQVCYRMRGEPAIEISTDGGKSWRIDWQMPAERQDYMARLPEMEDLLDVYPDTIPYDLAILETASGHVVLVAYGNQGVLVKSTDGAWKRVAIQADDPGMRAATPLPYQAADLDTAVQVLASETTFILLLSFFGLAMFASVGWACLGKKAAKSKAAKVDWLSILVFLSVTAFGLLGFLFMTAHRGDSTREMGVLNSGLVPVCMLPAIILMVVLFAMGGNLPNQKYVWRIGLLALGLAIGFFGLTWLPFGLWAWGIIPRYVQALSLVGVVGLVYLVFSFVAISSLVRGAPVPAEVVKGDELPGQQNTDSSATEK